MNHQLHPYSSTLNHHNLHRKSQKKSQLPDLQRSVDKISALFCRAARCTSEPRQPAVLMGINGYSFEIGGEVGPSLPRHKSLGTNPSVYKHQIPAKTRGLQEASANSRRDAKNRATSALQEGCPTHMANLKEPSIIQLDFSLSFL